MDMTSLQTAAAKSGAAARALIDAGNEFVARIASLRETVEMLEKKHAELAQTESRLEDAKQQLQTVQQQHAAAKAAFDAFVASLPR